MIKRFSYSSIRDISRQCRKYFETALRPSCKKNLHKWTVKLITKMGRGKLIINGCSPILYVLTVYMYYILIFIVGNTVFAIRIQKMNIILTKNDTICTPYDVNQMAALEHHWKSTIGKQTFFKHLILFLVLQEFPRAPQSAFFYFILHDGRKMYYNTKTSNVSFCNFSLWTHFILKTWISM